MSNTDTNNIGIKLQIAGENLNTWGDPNLNNDLSVLSNLASKFNPITINGDYNVGSNCSNYATNNPDEVACIMLVAGTVAANFNFIMAGRAKRLPIWNSTAYAAQIKLAATTGFSLPAGYIAMVTTDGVTDVYNVSPTLFAGAITVAGQIHGVSAASAFTDAVNFTQMQTAIATAGFPATSGTVLNSSNDTTAGYLSQKSTVAVSGAVTASYSTANPGANETNNLNIAVAQLGLTSGGLQSASFSPTAGFIYKVPTGGTITLPSPTGSGGVIGLAIFGIGNALLSGTVSAGGSILSSLNVGGDQTLIITDADATRGWV